MYNEHMKKIFSKSQSLLPRIVATILFVGSLIINGLAGTTILGGNTTAQVSDSFPNLFAPAGITFAIWGVIYLLVAAYCVRQFVGRDKKANGLIKKITPHFILLNALNMAWLLAWQYKVIWLSVLLIVAMLVVLVQINDRTKSVQLNRTDSALIRLPFQVYFGWLTVATIANITTWLVSIGWERWGQPEEFWMLVILIVGAIVGIVAALNLKSIAYIGVFIWAYFGIMLKHILPEYFDYKHPSVVLAVMLLIGTFALTAIMIYSRRNTEAKLR